MRRLIADIGGTNARFALVDLHGLPAEACTLPVAGFPGLVEAAQAYLAGRRVEEAVVAVATPVEGDAVSFTNAPWSFSVREVQARLDLVRFAVINDFVAQALAVPHLRPGEREQVGGGEPSAGRPVGVIGPGTGLGVSMLVEVAGRHAAFPTEGGHVSLAPRTPRERALLERLEARFGHVSNERVLSGPGLLNAAQALAELDGRLLAADTPEGVTRDAIDGTCPACAEVVAVFSALLGAAAGDLALTYGARGGVFIAGGLCLSLGSLFDRRAFRARFEDKGRMRHYLEPIPAYLVNRQDTGLLGVARYRLED
jgi:glucokinase